MPPLAFKLGCATTLPPVAPPGNVGEWGRVVRPTATPRTICIPEAVRGSNAPSLVRRSRLPRPGRKPALAFA